MALMEVQFFSEVLGMCCEANVILPQREQGIGVQGSGGTGEQGYPVLWLLHGASDDHTIWLRRTAIERYVAPLNLAVVMPSAHLSRYCNMAHGPRYYDYFTQELPRVMREFFPLSPRREDNYVAGLSMGGYGALKMGLGTPEQYTAIGCFSSGNLIHRRAKSPVIRPRASGLTTVDESVYGVKDSGELSGNPEFDIYAMAEQAAASGKPLPRIYHVCGSEDFLIDNARSTRDWFQSRKQFDYTYKEAPGEHNWEFWDLWVQDFLKWMIPQSS